MFRRIILLLTALVLVISCNPFKPAAIPAFYDPPVPLPAGKPGEIIRTEVLQGAPKGVKAWRVLYHSTTLDGSDIAVSAALMAPDTPAPANGFPILAEAHGTTGIAQGCAPSLEPFTKKLGTAGSFYSIYGAPFISQGYAVVMPDYQGMGAPGPFSYLVGDLEGKNTLDSIRAAKNFSDLKTSDQIFVWGHSQGGHASAFTSQLAASYAPDVKLSGAVMLAPAVELAQLVEHIFSAEKAAPTTGLMLMVTQAWPQAYPELQQVSLLKPDANVKPVLDECLLGAILPTLKPPSAYFTESPLNSPPWTARVNENIPDVTLLKVPTMIGQGEKDTIVYPPSSQAFAKSLCEAGTPVFFKFYPDAGHLDLPQYATADTLVWMQDILQGKPPQSNCN
jgi:pimeloyl-ACP methyl ester carboxylesterase